jgi:hypothetical protein
LSGGKPGDALSFLSEICLLPSTPFHLVDPEARVTKLTKCSGVLRYHRADAWRDGVFRMTLRMQGLDAAQMRMCEIAQKTRINGSVQRLSSLN